MFDRDFLFLVLLVIVIGAGSAVFEVITNMKKEKTCFELTKNEKCFERLK